MRRSIYEAESDYLVRFGMVRCRYGERLEAVGTGGGRRDDCSSWSSSHLLLEIKLVLKTRINNLAVAARITIKEIFVDGKII